MLEFDIKLIYSARMIAHAKKTCDILKKMEITPRWLPWRAFLKPKEHENLPKVARIRTISDFHEI